MQSTLGSTRFDQIRDLRPWCNRLACPLSDYQDSAVTEDYREIRPTPRLAAFIECFWTREVPARQQAHILPDGCADIIFYSRRQQLIKTEVVGVMTRSHHVMLDGCQTLLGVRFKPGMAAACLPCDLPSLNDQSVLVQTAFGSELDRLLVGVNNESCVDRRIEVIEDHLSGLPSLSRVQSAIGELVGTSGQIDLDDLSSLAGVGVRQLRRTCLKSSGLAPKQLARILRFRRAATMIRTAGTDMAEIALDCGYCDQSHMIREFRKLAGISPYRYRRQFDR